MYFGIGLVGLGYVLVLFNIWAFTLFLIFFVSRYIVLIFQEEKKLVLNFGQEYKDYMASTPRLVPGIKVFASKEMREILPLKLSWVKKEIGAFWATIIVILVIESWEGVRSGSLAAYAKELAVFVLFLALFFVLIKYLDIDRQTRVIK
jgi:tellurite resistance protein TehA-like permease